MEAQDLDRSDRRTSTTTDLLQFASSPPLLLFELVGLGACRPSIEMATAALLRTFGALRLAAAPAPTRIGAPVASSSRICCRSFSQTPAAAWKGGHGNPRTKLKSHKGAMKRFRVTKEGQFVRVRSDCSSELAASAESETQIRVRPAPRISWSAPLEPYDGVSNLA